MNNRECMDVLGQMLCYICDNQPNGANSIDAEALTHAIEHMKRGQWQPIETAPEDDLIVVTGGSYTSESTGREFYCVPFKGRAVAQWNKYEGQWDGCDCDNMVYHPTHWMPLPEPPQ